MDTVVEQVATQIAVTVTPLDPTKCYFIVLRGEQVMHQMQLRQISEYLRAMGIKCVVAQLPDSVEVECIEQEAP